MITISYQNYRGSTRKHNWKAVLHSPLRSMHYICAFVNTIPPWCTFVLDYQYLLGQRVGIYHRFWYSKCSINITYFALVSLFHYFHHYFYCYLCYYCSYHLRIPFQRAIFWKYHITSSFAVNWPSVCKITTASTWFSAVFCQSFPVIGG